MENNLFKWSNMKIFIINLVFWGSVLLFSCNTDIENIEIQKEIVQSEEYYENLRDYKKSDHAVCFGWYDGYTSESDPSAGHHFTGLPDSMDIVSLWNGIPVENENRVDPAYREIYKPIAYREMNYIRKVKGTKVVKCVICRIGNAYPHNDEGIEAYAMNLVNMILRNDLDGLDLDYEPEGDWLEGDKFVKFVKIIGQYLGPKSGTDKLLIIDGWNPGAEVEPYINYYVSQSYNSPNVAYLENIKYGGVKSWCPPHKFIITEHIGWNWETGGVPFTEADGNKFDSWGNPLYSAIGMARWNPKEGRKGGFGGFYFEYEYNTTRPANQSIGDKESVSIPYYSLRRGIQEQNPARVK